jgi:glycosyltransferase involved in cell wall biosynthesis
VKKQTKFAENLGKLELEAELDFSVIVPVYKEESNIRPFLNRSVPVIREVSNSYEIIFVVDPSPDSTENEILRASEDFVGIKVIKMSRRFGQPAATLAGLAHSTGERVVVIDVDLQDPPELIKVLNAKMNEGFDVVYATRSSREGETLTKKAVAKLGYKVINALSDVQIPQNTGDFRIMSRRVVDEICALNEKHGFLRGLVAYVGFNQTGVFYSRDSRHTGKGNYNRYLGSIRIGLNGLIGFSAKPLNVMSIFGASIALLSFFMGSWYALQKFLGVSLTPGLSTTVILISFFAGIQLLSLGLVGEYISRIYDEVKNRPMYIVEKRVGFDE